MLNYVQVYTSVKLFSHQDCGNLLGYSWKMALLVCLNGLMYI